MSSRPVIALVACACACSGVSGCGAAPPAPPSAPAANPQQPRSAVARAQATHEYRSRPAPAQTAAGASQSASAAIAAFATAYINWTAQTVSDDMRALAADSVGQARSAVQLAAAQTAGDYELQRGGIANTGAVEAVAPLRGHRDQYVVVTRESTTATATTAYQGLRPAWHLAIATVSLLSPGRWVVSGWQPES